MRAGLVGCNRPQGDCTDKRTPRRNIGAMPLRSIAPYDRPEALP
jgi:hypothetical protein